MHTNTKITIEKIYERINSVMFYEGKKMLWEVIIYGGLLFTLALLSGYR